MLLESISLFWNSENTLQENMGYLIHLFFSFLFFFLGGHQSTHCFQYLGHLSIFSTFFFSMNNFCIATCFFSATKLQRDINKNFGAFILSGCKTYQTCFFIHSQCRSKIFLGGSRWKACFCAYPQCRSSAYVGGVYVILILRA